MHLFTSYSKLLSSLAQLIRIVFKPTFPGYLISSQRIPHTCGEIRYNKPFSKNATANTSRIPEKFGEKSFTYLHYFAANDRIATEVIKSIEDKCKPVLLIANGAFGCFKCSSSLILSPPHCPLLLASTRAFWCSPTSSWRFFSPYSVLVWNTLSTFKTWNSSFVGEVVLRIFVDWRMSIWHLSDYENNSTERDPRMGGGGEGKTIDGSTFRGLINYFFDSIIATLSATFSMAPFLLFR